MSPPADLRCVECGTAYPLDHWGPCTCGGSVLVQLSDDTLAPDALVDRQDLWRYGPLLPVEPSHWLPLGEGGTPLRRMREASVETLGASAYLKDEGVSPTATFKARGMAVAVAMAQQLGLSKLAVPSAGNAGVALAAYAAAADIEALVLAPQDTPPALLQEIVGRGARCLLVAGPIDEAGRYVSEAAQAGFTNLATLREPYRVEGKKTMGFEIWEQLGEVPDWIVFPTGGGTGVVGLWKAFRELGDLGWTDGTLPRLCAVQSTGCPPLAQTWDRDGEELRPAENPRTVAVGLRVPRPTGHRLILRVIRETRGMVLAVPEEAIVPAALALGSQEGIFPCYEGAAAYLGLQALVRGGHVAPEDSVVVFNTGLGLINEGGEPPSLPVLGSPEEMASHLQS